MGSSTAIIIDDDPDHSQIFSELLNLLKIRVLGIGNTGFDAIDLTTTLKPDIVFLDIHMPELNGFEALKEIKKRSVKTHVVIITSDKFIDEKQLSEYGSLSTIFKPFDMDQVMKVIEKIKVIDNTVIESEKVK
ncbi:MAG: response regulator [Nitrosopumilus sp.]|nr:response regulator [Nitrosopumilus sp.]